MAIEGRLILLHKPSGESVYIGVYHENEGWYAYPYVEDNITELMVYGDASLPPTADDFELIYEKEE